MRWLDLNKLIPPGSGLQLTFALNINDRGEIVARSVPPGVSPNDDEDLGHLVLLIPCDEDSPCENSINSAAVQAQRPVTPAASPQPGRVVSFPKVWQSYRSMLSRKSFSEK